MLAGVQALHALTAGNAVIVKPAPGSRAVLERFAALLAASGLPADAAGDRRAVAADAAHALLASGVDKLVFTGSSGAGRELLAVAGGNLVPATLELSGWDACIVLDDADVERAAARSTFALTLNAGRTCLAPRRVVASPTVCRVLERARRRGSRARRRSRSTGIGRASARARRGRAAQRRAAGQRRSPTGASAGPARARRRHAADGDFRRRGVRRPCCCSAPRRRRPRQSRGRTRRRSRSASRSSAPSQGARARASARRGGRDDQRRHRAGSASRSDARGARRERFRRDARARGSARDDAAEGRDRDARATAAASWARRDSKAPICSPPTRRRPTAAASSRGCARSRPRSVPFDASVFEGVDSDEQENRSDRRRSRGPRRRLHLAARGNKVQLFEANSFLGGKAAVLETGGFRFDMGPTIITLPDVLRRIFEEAGRELEDYVTLTRLDPQWRCFFEDGSTLDLTADASAMSSQLETVWRPRHRRKVTRASWGRPSELHRISEQFFFWKSVGGLARHARSRHDVQGVDARRSRRAAHRPERRGNDSPRGPGRARRPDARPLHAVRRARRPMGRPRCCAASRTCRPRAAFGIRTAARARCLRR